MKERIAAKLTFGMYLMHIFFLVFISPQNLSR